MRLFDLAGTLRQTVRYEYDYADRRVARIASGVVENSHVRSVLDGDGIVADLDADGTLRAAYLALGGTVVAQERTGHAVEWLLTDQLGSTRQVVNSSGEVVAAYEYDSYGNPLSGTHDPTTRFTFTGLPWDRLTRTYGAWQRDLDPRTGWLRVDPIQDLSGQTNYYAYVHNSPVNFVDPTGLAGELTTRTTGTYATPHGHLGQMPASVPYGGSLGDRGAILGGGLPHRNPMEEFRREMNRFQNFPDATGEAWNFPQSTGPVMSSGGAGFGRRMQAAANEEKYRSLANKNPWLRSPHEREWMDGYALDRLRQDKERYQSDNDFGPWQRLGDDLFNPHWDGAGCTLNDRVAALPLCPNRGPGAQRQTLGRTKKISEGASTAKVHGNTAGEQPATLYEKYDANGNFLKHGISQDPSKRYTREELNGGYLIRTQTGPRKEMLRIERDLVERRPGPENKERWAGKRAGE